MPHLLHYCLEANPDEMQARLLRPVYDQDAETEEETLPPLPRGGYPGGRRG
jgi:hypothetical protein